MYHLSVPMYVTIQFLVNFPFSLENKKNLYKENNPH